ncbi:hypothetical protein EUX98_g8491 [Antrodiella citrinella]|uniref:DUF7330 domain-containing protein n=1 Tax=Antrodiella citrinella TaxID=2447956 RepID=A0A4S4MCZ6_9APHY|nr:hypothetical protein EUX98_g8491 [Antrodiella citrinella]
MVVKSEPPPYSTLSSADIFTKPTSPPSNFQHVQHNAALKGTYVIDASLKVPDDLLDATSGRRNKNLYLESMTGEIEADIWIVGKEFNLLDQRGTGSSSETRPRAVVDVNGITTRAVKHRINLHTTPGNPCTISIYAGVDVYLAIPSDFVGPISLKVTGNQNVHYSEGIQSILTTFSEANGKRRCFAGDIRMAEYKGERSWTGSTIDVTIEKCGSLFMFVLGEEPPVAPGGCTIM